MPRIKTKDITPAEYATLYGCCVRNITKHIKADYQLPHVIKVNKFGRFFTLTIPETLTTANFND